jgi:Fe-S-cluster containining protein
MSFDCKIPKQKTPFIVRYLIKILVYPFMIFDLFIRRCMSFFISTNYSLKGDCIQCGKCCEEILIEWPKYLDYIPFLKSLYSWWLRDINGFYFFYNEFEEIDEQQFRTVKCRYLSNNKCRHYFLRPMICRQYPKMDHFKYPHLFEKCGYRVVLHKKRKK